jgi:ABC-type proline/glycine betaine transport systems, periplasmic components
MKKRSWAAIAAAVAVTIGLAGCVSGDGTTNAAGPGNGDKGDVTIGVFNGWPEGEAASYLWKAVLEKKGYNVKLAYADAGPVFAGVSKGNYDLALDVWLPTTHAAYMKQYGKKVMDLGAWNKDAKLTMAVNKDAPIDSLDQLAGKAGTFGNTIVGIEPGAGLTQAVQDKTIPQYGLGKMKFVTSSTPAMLAELKKSIAAKRNIVVTLWRPQWAYDAFPIKDLADPKKTLGTAESIHSISRLDFAKDDPKLNGWLKKFSFDSDLLFSLENAMFNRTHKVDDYTPIVQKWMSQHKSFVAGLTN